MRESVKNNPERMKLIREARKKMAKMIEDIPELEETCLRLSMGMSLAEYNEFMDGTPND